MALTRCEELQVSEVLTELKTKATLPAPRPRWLQRLDVRWFLLCENLEERSLSLLPPHVQAPQDPPGGSTEQPGKRDRGLWVRPWAGAALGPARCSPRKAGEPARPSQPRPAPSPLHPLHQVGHQLVRDAGAGLLGQAEGVLQLLQRPHAPAALPVLLFELWTQRHPGCRPSPPPEPPVALPPPGKDGGDP